MHLAQPVHWNQRNMLGDTGFEAHRGAGPGCPAEVVRVGVDDIRDEALAPGFDVEIALAVRGFAGIMPA